MHEQHVILLDRQPAQRAAVSQLPLGKDSTRSGNATRRQIRGSSLLLAGRMVSIGINLATQILLARFLTKQEFGAFSYALAAVALGTCFTSLGLDKSARRFVPMFHEQRDFRRLMGTIVLCVSTILAIGLLLVAILFSFRELLLTRVVKDPLSLSLTLLMIALAPVEAINRLCSGLIATFAGARAIAVRQHVVGPTLKLTLVSIFVFSNQSVHLLVVGYLLAGIIGTSFYIVYLCHILQRTGLWNQLFAQKSIIPARSILGYSFPLLSSEFVSVSRAFLAVYFLGLFHGATMVAVFRVVLPIAGLNKIVFETFQFLYMPLASRLFAHDDRTGIDHLYWRTALWMTVLTYPIFLITFIAAEPITVLIAGSSYRDAGQVLAWLSLGFFLNVSLGFNALTLKVLGDVRRIVRNDVVTIAVTFGLYYVLVPTYGAVGAAIANCLAVVFQNTINQISLVSTSGISFFPSWYLRVYATLAIATVVLAVLHTVLSPPLPLTLAVSAAISTVMLFAVRHLLEVNEMFPELARLPIVGRMLGSGVTA